MIGGPIAASYIAVAANAGVRERNNSDLEMSDIEAERFDDDYDYLRREKKFAERHPKY